MTLHYAPTTVEEEELALALALSASLSSASAARKPSPPAAAPRPTPAASSSAHSLLQRLSNNAPHRQGATTSSSSSSSPARPRWQQPADSPASNSPRSRPPQSSFLGQQTSAAYSGRSPSPTHLARPPAQQQQYPQHLQRQPQSSYLPPIVPPAVPRSKSAAGPSSLFSVGGTASAGCDGSGGGQKSSVGAGIAAVVPTLTSPGGSGSSISPQPQQPLQLYPDPDACAGCGRGFGFFTLTWVTGMGRKWHAGCFKCGFCHSPISNGTGPFSYKMHPGDPLPYHTDCYRHLHHPICHVCGEFVNSNTEGVISYRENGFWREKYCTTHVEAELTRCCACSRIQKQGEEWAPLSDGRPLCLQCLSTVVLDTPDAQPLYDDVLAFYTREMHLPHAYKPPLLLVDGPTLNSHAEAEGRDDSAGAPVFHVRGLCVAHVYSHITTILRGAGGILRSVATELRNPASGGRGGGASRVHCHVKVLLLLYGLPRLLSGSIMAHELMHAWLRMEGVVGLAHKVEEGLCQLMACLWLDRQHELLKGKPEEQRLASFFSYQIRTDTSEVYGDGFREAMEAFQSIGLITLIQNVKRFGTFTPGSS